MFCENRTMQGSSSFKKWAHSRRRMRVRRRLSTRGAVKLQSFPQSDGQKTWSNTQQIHFTHNPNLTKNISMEIWSKEFKPIALESN